MPRRNLPQHKIDDRAFPIRVFVRVPQDGFGKLLTPMIGWLDAHCGRCDYAWHSSGSASIGNAVALYFRDPSQLAAFQAAWPMLELADGTRSRAYTSPSAAPPAKPHGSLK